MKRFGFFIMMYLLASFGAGAQGFTIKGTVVDQDGKPVAGAKVSFEGRASVLATTTDEEGLWQMTIEERSSQEVRFKVEADDYPSYVITAPFLNGAMSNINVELFNTLIYKAGEQSTIFLMEAPDPSWGRYYRLDRVDGSKLIFERELTPTGATPYIFFANEDLRIDLRGRAKQGAGRAFSIDNISFTGSLNVWEEVEYTGTMCWLIPDHSISMRQDPFPMYVYPMHAVLYWLRSDYPYTADEVSLVFHDAESTNYHPFVEQGKHWCVHGFNMGSSHTVTDYYFSNEDEAETIDGHTYLKMYAKTGEETTLVGLFREEDHRVYLYNKDAGRECLTYDFSLQEDDEFTPEYGDFSHGKVTKVSYKEVNGEQLKVLTIATSNGTDVEWIEGVGVNAAFGPSPLEGMYSIHEPNSWGYRTAYVLYDNSLEPNFYLPFSFGLNYNGWWGQQPQTVKVEAEDMHSGLGLHYILLPDPEHDCYALHVYGDTIWSNSPNRYVYCVEDKSTHTLKLQFEELEPSVGGTGRYHINLSFPFFLSGNRYVVVDEQGEHAVPVWQEPSDDYRPFIEEGKVWKVGHTVDYPGWFDKAMALEYFYFDGDTIVGDRQCKKMMRREEYANHETRTTFVGALYEDNRCVYYVLPHSTDIVILYDFGSPLGTVFDYYATETKVMTKGYIKERVVCEDETFHGWTSIITYYDNRDQIFIDYDPVNIIWREGVGFKGLYNHQEAFLEGGSRELMSCTVGDEVLYYDPSLIDCVTPDDGGEVKKNTIDFMHTVKTRPKAPRRGGVNETGDDEPLTGEYSLKELFVNFKPLAGPYVITICNDSGTEVYRKEVQTSNVIGLNTDISDYEKGEYTITVENEEEAYTAEFKIDEETGIKRPTPDPSRDGGEKAGAMYDLSGRRIANNSSARQLVHSSTLPKGIYIRGGRKVVVK